jgi:hypothetical protein
MNQEFQPFGKIPRLMREIVITEKIDGTNASVHIGEDGSFQVASRTRWITPEDDNYGFAKWAFEHKDELMQLGPGAHFGEWWGLGIQRNYGLKEKRFSLFNVGRWNESNMPPSVCDVVPVLYSGVFSQDKINECLWTLQRDGSAASPGFKNAEGVIVYHVAAGQYFKQTIEKDEEWKGKSAQ